MHTKKVDQSYIWTLSLFRFCLKLYGDMQTLAFELLSYEQMKICYHCQSKFLLLKDMLRMLFLNHLIAIYQWHLLSVSLKQLFFKKATVLFPSPVRFKQAGRREALFSLKRAYSNSPALQVMQKYKLLPNIKGTEFQFGVFCLILVFCFNRYCKTSIIPYKYK